MRDQFTSKCTGNYECTTNNNSAMIDHNSRIVRTYSLHSKPTNDYHYVVDVYQYGFVPFFIINFCSSSFSSSTTNLRVDYDDFLITKYYLFTRILNAAGSVRAPVPGTLGHKAWLCTRFLYVRSVRDVPEKKWNFPQTSKFFTSLRKSRNNRGSGELEKYMLRLKEITGDHDAISIDNHTQKHTKDSSRKSRGRLIRFQSPIKPTELINCHEAETRKKQKFDAFQRCWLRCGGRQCSSRS